MTPINDLYRYCGGRIVSTLKYRGGYTTVEQVAAASDDELLDLRGVGAISLDQIRQGVRKLLGETPEPPAPHVPRRGSDVEAWIKRCRDSFARNLAEEHHPRAWYALDDLLDDYRDHADTGTLLDQEIQGPHEEES